MTRAEFDELVRRMEARLAGRPAALARATTLWMVVGLAGFLVWVGLLSVLGMATFAIGVVLPFDTGVWFLIVGTVVVVLAISQVFLFFSMTEDPPRGHLLGPSEAPALRTLLGSLQRDLQCRPFDEVRVTMPFNAGVREVPRLGFLGWPRVILEIGLPLMEALSVEELTAVLAHEMAHGSARHARSTSRIYRLHRTWGVLFQQMERPPRGRFDRVIRAVASRFSKWYWPRLHARAMVLSRAHEYHADRVAAEWTDPAVVVSALWRIECANPLLAERFWEEAFQGAEQSPDPPTDIIERMRTAFRTPPPPEDASRWIDGGLNRTTGNDETHPAFADRARALGRSVEEIRRLGFPTPPPATAAQTLLGNDLAAIEAELTAEWQRSVIGSWRSRHRRSAAEARRREPPGGLQADPTASPPLADVAAAWEAARAAFELKGPTNAEPLLRAVLERDPKHPGAGLMLGSHLLNRGDPEGRRLLEQVAAQADAFWIGQACQALHNHFQATGQTAELQEMRRRLDQLDAASVAAQRERSTVRPGDSFIDHGLADEQLVALRAVLASQPDCGAAWLVRKELQYHAHRPLFVLCVARPSKRWWFNDPDADRDLVRRVTPLLQLPGQVLVVARSGSFRKLAARVMSVTGAAVFDSDQPGAGRPESSASGLRKTMTG